MLMTPPTIPLLQIIIATVISWQVNLEDKYGVDVVGVIPSGWEVHRCKSDAWKATWVELIYAGSDSCTEYVGGA